MKNSVSLVRLESLSRPGRIGLLITLAAFGITAVSFMPPIPQDPTYHLFADMRSCFGIPNFGDVSSNLGFALVGLLGLWTVVGPRSDRFFDTAWDRFPYVLFFLGVGLVSAGSAYYHAQPDNMRLLWDRLPMTVAFMALFSAIIADRVDRRAGNGWLLALLIILGFVSLMYWYATEVAGYGDLRYYGLVQFLPIVALPVICWLFPVARYTRGYYLAWVIGWYAVAKGLEHFDAEVFELVGRTISGHSLKHLASAFATLVVVRMIVASRSSRQS